jgi:cytoskeletal protein RodZ
MDSLGSLLKRTREEKGITIEHVSLETNIAIRYLKAFEEEDFAVFPGESYLMGFLRNYGDYLGLDSNQLLSLYRTIKIQEQPTPVDALLHTPPNIPKIIRNVVIIILALALVGGGVYFFLNPPDFSKNKEETPVYVPVEYNLESTFLERRLNPGDKVRIPMEDEDFIIELISIGDVVTLKTPVETLNIALNSSVSIPLDGESSLNIALEEFDKANPSVGALLRFEKTENSQSVAANPLDQTVQSTVTIPNTPAGANTRTIFTSANAYPFTVNIRFIGYCMFRWEILNEASRQGRNEQYFQSGNELNIQAQNGIRLWISNSAAVNVEVIGGGRTLQQSLGGAGEVVVCEIRWLRDETGYRLALVPIE